MHRKKYAWQAEVKNGIVMHRCGKVKPQRRQMRARHPAKGTRDLENSISRADASEIF
jgi:hypothetical protein